MVFEVKEDIPIPEHLSSPRVRNKYPWETIKVGASFLIKCSKDNAKVVENRARCSASSYRGNGKVPKHFTVVFEYDALQGGLRVWRQA